jgi:hypothetical protein
VQAEGESLETSGEFKPEEGLMPYFYKGYGPILPGDPSQASGLWITLGKTMVTGGCITSTNQITLCNTAVIIDFLS